MNGTAIQIEMLAASVNGLAIDHIAVVEQASGANGATTPTKITVGGSHGTRQANSIGRIRSDVIPFIWDQTKGHLFIIDFTSGSTQKVRYGTPSNYTHYNKNAPAATWNQQNMNPDNTVSNQMILIAEISVFV